MMVNININDFPKWMSTLAMQSNGPLPQVNIIAQCQWTWDDRGCGKDMKGGSGLAWNHIDNTKGKGIKEAIVALNCFKKMFDGGNTLSGADGHMLSKLR
jgi:hypothetical protein